jgi:hypothetical protein
MAKEQLTEHFTLEEMTKTGSKADNTPSAEQVDNLLRVCLWLEMLRDQWNRKYGDGDDPIIVNSGFRSAAVNKEVGGVANSNHLTGCAVDIRVTGMDQMIHYANILIDISDEANEPFDELLMERKDEKMWLHFAVRPTGNRRKINILTTTN